MTAEEIMTDAVITVPEQATLAEALELLTDQNIRHLPVIRNGTPVGIISDRDLRSLGISLLSDIQDLHSLRSRLDAKVASLMKSDLISVERETPTSEIAELMLSEKVGAVLVVDSDTETLVGIVSYVDILQALLEQMD